MMAQGAPARSYTTCVTVPVTGSWKDWIWAAIAKLLA
jgi:hypothetical protein